MAEQFINYRVELVLHDSSKIRGFVKGINNKDLTITDAEFIGQDKVLNTYTISGNLINDLSVVDIPKEALVRKKKNNSNNAISQNDDRKVQTSKTPIKAFVDDAIISQYSGLKASNRNSPKPQQPLVDDAIIFAKPAKSKNESNKSTSGTNSPKPSKRKISGKNHKANNGEYHVTSHKDEETWTDDIAHIKESQDFDFATNLALFDKASVFEDLKSKDKISYANRLAGHNKAESPAKKVNYDNKEMVLKGKEDIWDDLSAVGESPAEKFKQFAESPKPEEKEVIEEFAKKLDFSDGKAVSTKKTILQKPGKVEISKERNSSIVNRPPVFSPVEFSSSDLRFLLPGTKSALSLCSPLQLLEIERLSTENFGITGQLFAENASVSVARLIIRNLGGAGRLNNNHNKPPLVLVLVGNNRAGARALATGRQLANRGVRVIAFVLNGDIGDIVNGASGSKNHKGGKNNNKKRGNGKAKNRSKQPKDEIEHDELTNDDSDEKEVFYDSKEEFNADVKEQLKLFVAYGGKVFNNMHNMQKSLNALDSPLELVIDALQGFDTNLSDLWGEELGLCLKLIKWVNDLSTKVKIVSFDIASGLDGGSGHFSLTANDVEQFIDIEKRSASVTVESLRVKADTIVSLGLPVIGLLHAYYLGVVEVGDWTHYLIDVGIPQKVYSTKGSLRKFDKPYFGEEWHTELSLSQGV